LRAYMWYSLSTESSGDKVAAERRDMLAIQLTADDIGRAIARASACRDSDFTQC